MSGTAIALAAVLVDLLIGDPAFIPHPVVGMGKLVAGLERTLRRRAPGGTRDKLLGIVLVIAVLACVGVVAYGILYAMSAWLPPIVRIVASIGLTATTIAFKGLADAAVAVYRPLASGDLPAARMMVGRIVGRDTERLPVEEIARAAVETTAENIVDAAIAPIFYAIIGGAPLALLYRAINTMDSMIGYKNERYRHFGWAAARLDDAANYVPARLTGALLWGIAWMTRELSAAGAWRIMHRDARKHPSPNSGIPEAAMAGALGIRLGGRNTYDGQVSLRATMGDPAHPIAPEDILRAVSMLRKTAVLTMLLLAAATIWKEMSR